MSDDDRGAFIRVGGLWLKDGKRGPFWTGSCGGLQLYLFPNEKRDANDPDFTLHFAARKPREQPPASSGSGEEQRQRSSRPATAGAPGSSSSRPSGQGSARPPEPPPIDDDPLAEVFE